MLAGFPQLIGCRCGQDTILNGVLPDPPALYGVIRQLEALGLELLDVSSEPFKRRRCGASDGHPPPNNKES
jgi:hypothetical protein